MSRCPTCDDLHGLLAIRALAVAVAAELAQLDLAGRPATRAVVERRQELMQAADALASHSAAHVPKAPPRAP